MNKRYNMIFVLALVIWIQPLNVWAQNLKTGPDLQLNQIQAALMLAKQRQKEASQLGFEWSTIQPLIQDAEQSLQQGDLQTALSLAEEAQKHAELAIAQAIRSEQNWSLELPPMLGLSQNTSKSKK